MNKHWILPASASYMERITFSPTLFVHTFFPQILIEQVFHCCVTPQAFLDSSLVHAAQDFMGSGSTTKIYG